VVVTSKVVTRLVGTRPRAVVFVALSAMACRDWVGCQTYEAATLDGGLDGDTDDAPTEANVVISKEGGLTNDGGDGGSQCKVSPDCPFFPGMRCLDGGCVSCLQMGSGCTSPDLCCDNAGCHVDGDGLIVCL
jgi:hypothetical protein